MKSLNKATKEMWQHCKIAFKEYCSKKKKYNSSSSSGSTSDGSTSTLTLERNQHQNEQYTSDIPAAIPVRQKVISSKTSNHRNTNHQIMKQKQKQLDDNQNKIKRQQKKKNETVTAVPRSIITMNSYGTKNKSSSVVRFDMNLNERYEIESHMDFSKKERSNYWWNSREKDKTMDKLERLIAKYEQRRKQTKRSTNFFRGIESWTTTGSLKLDHDIDQCRRAVMDEQKKQWNSMKTIEYDYDYYDYDPIERIANCSRKVTYDNTQRAHLNGLEDAQEAWQLTGESWMQQNFVSDDINSVGSKKGSRRLLSRHDSFMNGSKSISKNNKEDDTSTLYSLKSNSSMTSLRKKWVPKKNKQMTTTTTTTTTTIANNEEENDGVMTMTQSKMVKETKSSKSSNATKKLSSDPPGSRLIIQEDENEMV